MSALPPCSPSQAAQYEELLAGALQTFYRTTMQARQGGWTWQGGGKRGWRAWQGQRKR